MSKQIEKDLESKLRKANSLFDKGNRLSNEEKLGFAFNIYNSLITEHSVNPEVYHHRGYAYMLVGEFDKAIEDFNETIELNPKHPVAYVNRGLAYHLLGEFDKAIVDFSKAIELNPKDLIAYLSRGNSYKSNANSELAIEDYKKVCTLFTEKNKEIEQYVLIPHLKKIDYISAIMAENFLEEIDFKKQGKFEQEALMRNILSSWQLKSAYDNKTYFCRRRM